MNQLKPSPAKNVLLTEARIAGLVVFGLLLFIFESYLPRPIPWLKFGLANIATLIALYWLGWKEALLVSLYRIVIGAFFVGNLFTPGFFLSISGGLLAVLMMGIFFHLKIFGIISVSIAGSIFHNLGQVVVAVAVLFKNAIVWYILPYLLLTALFTGVVIGIFSFYLLKGVVRDFKD
jgi:heptaprenyl diphosphate synthase